MGNEHTHHACHNLTGKFICIFCVSVQTLHKHVYIGAHGADCRGRGYKQLGTAQVLWNSNESSYRLSCLSSLTPTTFKTQCISMLLKVYYRLVEAELKIRLLQDMY